MGEITDKIKGTFKEVAGRATGDHGLEREGRFDQAKGDVKGAANDAHDTVADAVDEARDRLDRSRRDDEF